MKYSTGPRLLGHPVYFTHIQFSQYTHTDNLHYLLSRYIRINSIYSNELTANYLLVSSVIYRDQFPSDIEQYIRLSFALN